MPCVAEGVLNGVGWVAGLLAAGAPLSSGVARATGHPELGRSRRLLRESGDQQEHGCSTKRPAVKERGGGGGASSPSDPSQVTRAVAKNIHFKSILYAAYAGKEISQPTARGRKGELEVGVGGERGRARERGNYYES